jgi:hypothetical protein
MFITIKTEDGYFTYPFSVERCAALADLNMPFLVHEDQEDGIPQFFHVLDPLS